MQNLLSKSYEKILLSTSINFRGDYPCKHGELGGILRREKLYSNQAQNAYEKFGFGGYELDPEMGGTMFWQKSL